MFEWLRKNKNYILDILAITGAIAVVGMFLGPWAFLFFSGVITGFLESALVLSATGLILGVIGWFVLEVLYYFKVIPDEREDAVKLKWDEILTLKSILNVTRAIAVGAMLFGPFPFLFLVKSAGIFTSLWAAYAAMTAMLALCCASIMVLNHYIDGPDWWRHDTGDPRWPEDYIKNTEQTEV